MMANPKNMNECNIHNTVAYENNFAWSCHQKLLNSRIMVSFDWLQLFCNYNDVTDVFMTGI